MGLIFGRPAQPMIEEVVGEEWEHLKLDSKTMLRDVKTFKAACRRMDEMRAELSDLYPKQWVAVGKDGLIAHASSVEDVVATVHDQAIGPSEYKLAYLDPDTPRYMLL